MADQLPGKFTAPMKAVSRARHAGTRWGPDWAVELKWDGMRLQAHVGRDRTDLYSGSGNTVTSGFPELAGLGSAIGLDAVLDGEAVVFDEGRPSFAHLQSRIHVTNPNATLVRTMPVVYLVFDLLRLDGHDLCGLPYRERRRLLEDLVEDAPAWKVPPYSIGEAETLLALAEERSLEGIVLKRLDGTYQPGRRSQTWVKVKVRHRQEFVVGGWTEGRNSLAGRIGSLLLGVHTADGLAFVGAVGSGLTDVERDRLASQLDLAPNPFIGDPTAIAASLAGPPQWARPTLVVEVEYSLWPMDGALWHPVYLGQRVDRDAGDVMRETF